MIQAPTKQPFSFRLQLPVVAGVDNRRGGVCTEPIAISKRRCLENGSGINAHAFSFLKRSEACRVY